MTTAGFNTLKLSIRIVEMMIASQSLIGARMTMMGAGIGDARKMPLAEMSRLVPEKTAAFGKANRDAMHALAGTAKGGAPGFTCALVHDSLALLDLWERSVRAANAWWYPYTLRPAPMHAAWGETAPSGKYDRRLMQSTGGGSDHDKGASQDQRWRKSGMGDQ